MIALRPPVLLKDKRREMFLAAEMPIILVGISAVR